MIFGIWMQVRCTTAFGLRGYAIKADKVAEVESFKRLISDVCIRKKDSYDLQRLW